MTKLRRLLEISCLRKLLDGMLLKETFSATKFSLSGGRLRKLFKWNFMVDILCSTKYSYYLHRLLLYTVLLPLKFSILMFKLFCWILHLNIDSTSFAPLPNDPYPTPFPNPSCPHPLAPFCNPYPQQFCPPLLKVNWWLKIVNYFTCMRHLFCRW